MAFMAAFNSQQVSRARQRPLAASQRRRRRHDIDENNSFVSTEQFVVIGGGSFGLAIAHVLGARGVKTTLIVRKDSVADKINNDHRHPQ